MSTFTEFNGKSNKDLLEILSNKRTSNYTHNQDTNVGDRDLIKAILDVRSTEATQKQNLIMIVLTTVLAVLTGLLFYKEFFG